MKRCPCCGEEKTVEEFCKDRNAKDGRKCYCRLCSALKQKQLSPEKAREYQDRWRTNNIDKVRTKTNARYAANPAKGQAKAKQWRDKHRERLAPVWRERRRNVTLNEYGLTPEKYAARLALQEDACAICHSSDPVHWSGRFQVDHDHVTGEVRGLLCSRCNGGLGMFSDDVERLRKAILYIANAIGQETAQVAAAGFFRAS